MQDMMRTDFLNPRSARHGENPINDDAEVQI
jgi:hypothetical protein